MIYLYAKKVQHYKEPEECRNKINYSSFFLSFHQDYEKTFMNHFLET